MKTNYIAPLTEIVLINADNYLEDSQDSTGKGDPYELDANTYNFEESENIGSGKSIWED